MRNYYLILILALILATFTGCDKEQKSKPAAPPIKITTAKVERGDLNRFLHVSGPLRFRANTMVSAEIEAQVESIEVTDGQIVEQGQALLVFDDSKIREIVKEAEHALKRDEALMKFGKAEYEKNLSLLKSGAVSQTAFDEKLSIYDNLKARVEMDRASLASAREDLKDTQVKAPISGRISKRYVEIGDWVTKGANLFRISDFTRIYLEAHVSDLAIARLNPKKIFKNGIEAQVLVDSYPGKVFKGELTYIEPVASESRLFEIRIYMDNNEMLLLEGMYARGKIALEKLENRLKIPVHALLDEIQDNNYNTVFVINKENKAELTRIQIGAANRNFAEVKDGIKEGQTVAIKGKEILTTGASVEPVAELYPNDSGN